jgi:hypothetical protein
VIDFTLFSSSKSVNQAGYRERSQGKMLQGIDFLVHVVVFWEVDIPIPHSWKKTCLVSGKFWLQSAPIPQGYVRLNPCEIPSVRHKLGFATHHVAGANSWRQTKRLERSGVGIAAKTGTWLPEKPSNIFKVKCAFTSNFLECQQQKMAGLIGISPTED